MFVGLMNDFWDHVYLIMKVCIITSNLFASEKLSYATLQVLLATFRNVLDIRAPTFDP